MTRKSRGELEDALGSMGAGDTRPRCWVRKYLETRLAGGFDYCIPGVDEIEEDSVCILDTGQFKYYVPPADVPKWIDVDENLPLEAQTSGHAAPHSNG